MDFPPHSLPQLTYNVGTICYHHQKVSTRIHPKNVHKNSPKKRTSRKQNCQRKFAHFEKKCPLEVIVHKMSPSIVCDQSDWALMQFWNKTNPFAIMCNPTLARLGLVSHHKKVHSQSTSITKCVLPPEAQCTMWNFDYIVKNATKFFTVLLKISNYIMAWLLISLEK